MSKSLTQMAAEIVAAQSSHTAMSPEDLNKALLSTFEALKQIRAEEEGMTELSSETSSHDPLEELRKNPRKSIQKNKVICLECGSVYKILTNKHLSTHGMTSKEYRQKYGFKSREPLAAKSLTNKRKRMAKERNLGERLTQARLQKKRLAESK